MLLVGVAVGEDGDDVRDFMEVDVEVDLAVAEVEVGFCELVGVDVALFDVVDTAIDLDEGVMVGPTVLIDITADRKVLVVVLQVALISLLEHDEVAENVIVDV